MKKALFFNVTAILAALFAAVISYQLLAKHVTGTSGPRWFDAGCSDDPKASTNCGAVLASPYGTWPRVREGDPPDKARVPVAFLGLLYYSVLAVWFLGIGSPSHGRRLIHLIPLLLIVCGLAGSAYFLYIMFNELDQWCTWCLVTHVLNLLIAVAAILMWPPRPKAAALPGAAATSLVAKVRAGEAQAMGSTAPLPKPPPPPTRQPVGLPHPTSRSVLITAAAVVLVIFGQREMFAKSKMSFLATSAQKNFNQCRQLVDKMKADPENLVAFWKKEPEHEIPIREDDPVRTHATGDAEALVIVAFSDLECPSCKRFAQLVETKIQPLFDGHLSVVFKHHPLDKTCNERISGTVHPHACVAARMAEAARALGGNDAFWRAHDYLFEHQADLEKGLVTPQKLASALQLDPAAFQSAMESEEVTARIRTDVELANQINVATTPAIYVAGRLVDTIPRGEISFWDKLADMYWGRVGVERPEKTKLPPATATPNTPGRKVAP